MIIDLGRKDYKLSLVSQRLDALYAVQGETARTFKFKLVDSEGQSVDAANYTLTLSIAYYTGVVSCSTKGSADGTFTLVLPQDVLIDYGDYLCQIQISQDQDMVASAIGEIHIERNLQIDNGHGSNLLVDFKVIKQHVVMVNELANEVNGVLNKTITQSDRACQCADKSQQLYDSLATVMAEETERKNAENVRKKAETDRTQAENERKSAEVLRDQRITESVQKVNESIQRVDESIQKLGKGVNLEPIKEDMDKKLDKSGGTMTGKLVATPDGTGVAQVYNMVVVAKGASTANIPNNTIIVEVE